jgi:hypothetical protein
MIEVLKQALDVIKQWNTPLSKRANVIEKLENAIAELEKNKDMREYRHTALLLSLLAVIHRDGGHHTADVGLEQSVKDAMEKVSVLNARGDKS